MRSADPAVILNTGRPSPREQRACSRSQQVQQITSCQRSSGEPGPRHWGPPWRHTHHTGWAAGRRSLQARRVCAPAWQGLRPAAEQRLSRAHTAGRAAGCQGNGLFPCAFLVGPLHDQASPSISAAFLFGLIPSPLIPRGHVSPSSGQTMLLALPPLLSLDRQPGPP